MKMLKFCTFFTLLTMTLYSTLVAQDVQTLMSKGDSSYHAYNNEAALEYFTKVLEMDENNYGASWKLARAYVDVGETKQDKEERKAFYKNGEEFARKAVKIDSNGAKGHLFLSIAIGRVALDAGKKEQVRLSKEVKSEVDKALDLDPNDDIAWHVLGRWHRKMATLNWIQRNFANIFLGGVPKEASVEKSAECFQKAIEINPGHINHYLELGITYEKLKDKENAISQYEKVISLPKADADDEKYKEEAQIRLSKLKK